MALAISTEPLTITQTQARDIAALLTIDDELCWQSTVDENNKSDYAREQRATLSYGGTDPLLAGARVDLWTERYRQTGKYHISLNLHAGPTANSYAQPNKYIPDTLPYHERLAFVSSINVAASKPPARIAKEIQTRLLTHYLPAYRHAMTRLQEEEAQKVTDRALLEELAGILGCQVEGERHGNPPRLYKGRIHGLSVQHGRVDVERQLHLSPQQARELCALVATWED